MIIVKKIVDYRKKHLYNGSTNRKGVNDVKKKYRLKKEIKEELIQMGIDTMGIITAIGMVYLLILLNAIIF